VRVFAETDRPNNRQTLQMALLYAGQVVFCRSENRQVIRRRARTTPHFPPPPVLRGRAGVGVVCAFVLARLLSTSQERLVAVVIGCVTALSVQLLAEALRKRLGWHGPGLSGMPNWT